jgi:iron complex outermembrane receptor protein
LAGVVGRSILGAAALICGARIAAAQAHACETSGRDSAGAATKWVAPLNRPLTLHARDSSLRDAIDRVGAVAHIRISYSPDLLPLDRAVCISADSVAVGRVLNDLLAGMNVAPVSGGGDQVVLAPQTNIPPPSVPEMASSLGMLDRVVVTGSAMGAPEREITMGLDVISGQQLARENSDNLSSALDSYVPGVWAWAQSPSNLVSSFGSIRGASSFGLSYPKVYIDGIEVANPLLVSHFAPDAVDRIEVIRGPQGSSLYGTDAISGVINVVSRHEGANGAGENASVRSSAGVTQSAFSHGVLRQEHSVSLVTGSDTQSADLHVTAGSIGDFIPNGYSRDLTANASARLVGARTTLSGTARYFMEQAGSARSPLLVTPPPPADTNYVAPAAALPQSVDQYTVGVSGTFAPNDLWTHSVIAGIDGYSLSNVQTNFTPIPNVADATLRDAEGSAARGTVRLSSVLHLMDANPTRATFTFSAEQASLREASVVSAATHQRMISWQNSTGVGTQANLSFQNAFFVTAGLRVEYDSRLNTAQQFATLPMVGLASVRDFGPFTLKVHGSYGKGVRPPSTLGHSEFWQTRYGSATQRSLGAEEQAGTEVGLDVLVRRALSLHITRFDQLASGLIQQVAVPADSNVQSRRVTYLLENVGQISNRGWEFEASAGVGRLSASGTLSLVNSRVTKLAPGYTGDLMTGGRMLEVPARTGGLNLSWLEDRWSASLGGQRALDWINYDQLALSQAFMSGEHAAHEFLGPQLRQYWRRYDGGVRLHFAASRDLRDRFAIEVRGDNLLNYQRGEPDNITVVPGRTIMTGLRIKF